ncbi:MAG: hypothetical protein KBI30_04205, partial [Candidatus Atribacteria bacterium]|nr:hypothetical protein [Candidatus Atribacteria bacterium]
GCKIQQRSLAMTIAEDNATFFIRSLRGGNEFLPTKQSCLYVFLGESPLVQNIKIKKWEERLLPSK